MSSANASSTDAFAGASVAGPNVELSEGPATTIAKAKVLGFAKQCRRQLQGTANVANGMVWTCLCHKTKVDALTQNLFAAVYVTVPTSVFPQRVCPNMSKLCIINLTDITHIRSYQLLLQLLKL